MTDKGGQGQADKKAAEERTARTAAEKSQSDEESTVDPYPNYDLMTLEELRSLAKERDVEINRDVEKAHLVTELRAADTQTR